MSLKSLVNHPVMLAPMVGLSHFVVRRAVQEYLPATKQTLWPTEMLSSRRVPSQNLGQTIEVMMGDYEYGLCPQLLGNEEGFIRDSIIKLEKWGAKAIDINMGCPVSQALKHNYGVALMGDQDYAAKVCGYAVQATHLPVSVKLRAGLTNDPIKLLEFTKKMESAGVSWITIHPRLSHEMRRGRADWQKITFLKKGLAIPVIGNGDIQVMGDVWQMLESTGCDRVMIGRALLAKPWLMALKDILDPLEAGHEFGIFLNRVLALSREFYPESLGLRKFRFLVHHSAVWMEFGHTLFSAVSSAESYNQTEHVLNNFFKSPQKQYQTTNLRH